MRLKKIKWEDIIKQHLNKMQRCVPRKLCGSINPMFSSTILQEAAEFAKKPVPDIDMCGCLKNKDGKNGDGKGGDGKGGDVKDDDRKDGDAKGGEAGISSLSTNLCLLAASGYVFF